MYVKFLVSVAGTAKECTLPHIYWAPVSLCVYTHSFGWVDVPSETQDVSSRFGGRGLTISEHPVK